MTATEIKDYSQRGEQRVILSALAGIEQGRFLDVGSWNAKDLSNTRALYELGWCGVMIEPSPLPYWGLLQEYGNEPRISLICAAVGMERRLERFHFSADALSTNSRESYERWRPVGGFVGAGWVPMLTLQDVMNQFGAFDFVSIDTEGSSVELFQALLATEMLPKCICVEHDSRFEECGAAARRRGYSEVLRTGENLVYAR